MDKSAESGTTDERSRRLTWLAAGLLALESAGLFAGAGFFGWETITNDADSMAAALSLIAMAALLAIGLGVCVAGVLRRAAWVRGPVFTWQLVQGGVAMRLAVLVSWWIGLPLLAVAVVLGVLIAGPWVIEPRERSF